MAEKAIGWAKKCGSSGVSLKRHLEDIELDFIGTPLKIPAQKEYCEDGGGIWSRGLVYDNTGAEYILLETRWGSERGVNFLRQDAKNSQMLGYLTTTPKAVFLIGLGVAANLEANGGY
ncbi:hypothetical protein FB451DRAFT_1190452 [Mycena latifolia]|nr:hypothetical protein FB451DRAFT_1190452 [Mycena latifolia]